MMQGVTAWHVGLLAALSGSISMAIHQALSPRFRVRQAAHQASAARRALASYDGPADGLWRLAAASLTAALRHFGLSLLPALPSVLPLVTTWVWLDHFLDKTPVFYKGPSWLQAWPAWFWIGAIIGSLVVRATAKRRPPHEKP